MKSNFIDVVCNGNRYKYLVDEGSEGKSIHIKVKHEGF